MTPATETRSGTGAGVDEYWSEHTVRAERLGDRQDSERFLEWRFDEYPLFREFSGLWGEHDGETILDYGCGPGNDLTGFATHTGARCLIGIDVSPKALELAAERLALHGIEDNRFELIQASDSSTEIPLPAASVDHVNCQGVLHHTSDPAAILDEFERVLRPAGTGCLMIYNRDSVWFHLYVAYEKMILRGEFPGADIHEAFRRSTDGPECPISRSYPPAEFVDLCAEAGFETDYKGGYLARVELDRLAELWTDAIVDTRLDEEHRSFLRGLTYDREGRPMRGGMHAGIGGVFQLHKPAREG